MQLEPWHNNTQLPSVPRPDESSSKTEEEIHTKAEEDTSGSTTNEVGIHARTFYSSPDSQFGKSQPRFIPPALRPGVGRQEAVRAVCRDENNQWIMHFTQSGAFEFCDQRLGNSLRTWGCEISADGKRKFITASTRAFWRQYSRILRREPAGVQAHYYEIIREQHAAKLYLDLEFKRAFNSHLNIEAANEMADFVIDECFRHAGIPKDEKIIILDSTNDKKFSRHVIFESLVFYSNIQMGPFMRHVVDSVTKQAPEKMLVYNDSKQEERIPFVDLGVYTRNRCFRLVGSSKFGKTTRLRFPFDESIGIVRVSRAEFVRSLVCNICSQDSTKLRMLGQPDIGTIPASYASKSSGRKRVRINSSIVTTASSPFQLLDEYVMSIVGGCGGGIYGVTVFGNIESEDADENENDDSVKDGQKETNEERTTIGSGSGGDTIMYTIKGSYKYCAKIGRHHKSNNVILVALLAERLMFQRCFDPDCRGFRSAPWPIPEWVFTGKDAENKALLHCLDEVERATAVDGGVSDELMILAIEGVYSSSLEPNRDSKPAIS